ncbi:MAG: hypothetical protein ICV60_22865 [Pyrinomonadaceae bacterium]|nr:hypothetical protein [Pyrinomonadaceae bacterium]
MIATNGKPIYVLGTGLSHDGSACLLKDGRICVAIEKERLTRRKHDGGNDTDAIGYCLQAAGITYNDLLLVVQNAISACSSTATTGGRGPESSTTGCLSSPSLTIWPTPTAPSGHLLSTRPRYSKRPTFNLRRAITGWPSGALITAGWKCQGASASLITVLWLSARSTTARQSRRRSKPPDTWSLTRREMIT